MAPRNFYVSPRRTHNMIKVDHKDSHAMVKKLEAVQTAEQLNSVAMEVENLFQVISKKDEKTKQQKKQQQKTAKLNSNRPNEIQELFTFQQRRATQEVLFGPTEYCTIKSDAIREHCEKTLNAKPKLSLNELPKFAWPQEEPSKESNAAFSLNFTKEEVLRKLEAKRANTRNSCPGPDNLTYIDLLNVDPNCEILTSLFNACLKFQMVPNCWKLSFTILVHKSGDKNVLNNWRQITMCNTTAKLFSSVLATRLSLWTTNNKRISPTQKGYLPYDASCENSFILQECKVDAKRRGKQLVVAMLDFSKAFESIPQASVHNALRQHAVPEFFRNIIKSMYDGAQTKVRTVEKQGYTDPINITAGMRQGCPLSPILFNLAIEPILRLLSANPAKYKLYSQDLNHLAFADDLTLISDSANKMKDLLRTAEDTASSIGLTFNTEKSIMMLHGIKKSPQPKFILQGRRVPILEKGQTYKYLGVTHSYSIGQTDIPTVEEMINHVGIINSSNLSSFQKIAATGYFIIPRVEGCLRGLPDVTKAPLKQADKILKEHARHWLKLPQQASPEVITMPLKEGGAGILPFNDLTDIMKIIQAFKMLTANDPIVKCVALDSLRLVTSLKMGKSNPNAVTYQEMTSFLSGAPCLKVNDVMTTWTVVRQATNNLKKKLCLSWQSTEDGEIQLVVQHNQPDKKDSIIRGKDRMNVTRRLKVRLVEYNREMLFKKNPKGFYGPRSGRKRGRINKRINSNKMDNKYGAKQLVEQNSKENSNKEVQPENTEENVQSENIIETIQSENSIENVKLENTVKKVQFENTVEKVQSENIVKKVQFEDIGENGTQNSDKKVQLENGDKEVQLENVDKKVQLEIGDKEVQSENTEENVESENTDDNDKSDNNDKKVQPDISTEGENDINKENGNAEKCDKTGKPEVIQEIPAKTQEV